MTDIVDRLRSDVYAEVFDGLCMVGSSRESVNAQAVRRTDNIMKHVAYHATRWIPVSERLPQDGEVVAVFMVGEYEDIATYQNGDFWSGFEDVDVTHWMPLPEPPTTVTEQT